MSQNPYLRNYDATHPVFQHYTRKNAVNFYAQKSMAKKRKITWNFTFDEWILWWLNTGHFQDRGVHNYKYQMCRYDDNGPYEPSNVYCDTGKNNKLDCDKQGWVKRGVFATNIKTKHEQFFHSLSQAAVALFNDKTISSSISQCCQGYQKTCRGYTFKYAV